ncbi:hypothetical protein EDC04DRAFT_368129 [Pisolithus marmoratus]|nr:hypothetical protein EDC04DRAFT_368129 [Pisolithus marmoratus]
MSVENTGLSSDDIFTLLMNYLSAPPGESMPLGDDSMPEHHQGSTSVPLTLSDAMQETPVGVKQVKAQNDYTNCPYIPCRYTDIKGRECSQRINCGCVPDHFKEHNIKNLGRKHPLICGWQGCGRTIKRHNYVRHVRECHLNHDRFSAHLCGVGSTHGNESGG